MCPLVSAISPSILARSLQKCHTVKNRHSIQLACARFVQFLAIFWPKIIKNLQVLMWAVMQDFKAPGYFSMDILMDIPTVHHQVHHQVHGVTIRQIFSYFLAKNVPKFAIFMWAVMQDF